MKHTPGPWRFPSFQSLPEDQGFTNVLPQFDPDGIGWKSKSISISNQSDEVLAEVKVFDTKGFVRDFGQFEANAYLICSAPELLEALQVAEFRLQCILDEGPDDTIDMELTVVKAAIKKARGL